MGPHGARAQAKALAEIREFLQQSAATEFATAEEFADKLAEVIESAFETTLQDAATIKAVKAVTTETYRFYRLLDETPFGEAGSPVTMTFGGADRRAVKFFDALDSFYFSKFMRNDDAAKPLRKFLRDEYLAKGAALFGRETPESLDDFRQAAGEKLKNLTDPQIKRIVMGSVQRLRNWAHVGSLSQAEFAYAEYVAVIDKKTTPICRRIDGVKFSVTTAQSRIEELSQLAPGDFALQVYESTAAREYQKDPVAWIEKRITDGVIDDDALQQNIGIPPLHFNCRTWIEGVFEELS